jgi:Arc/MetJ-type ribon-helix-helix transcriptional regulator
MSYEFPHDIQNQVDQLMATGAFHTEEDLLRIAVSSLASQQEDLLAVAASLADFDNGERGIPAAESLLQLRSELGI